MNIGFGELILILAIVLLIVGAKRLPEIGRSLGEAVREFQGALRGSSRRKDDPPSEKRH